MTLTLNYQSYNYFLIAVSKGVCYPYHSILTIQKWHVEHQLAHQISHPIVEVGITAGHRAVRS